MDQRGLSPKSDTVRQMAYLLLQKRSDSIQGNQPTAGSLRVHNSVRRHEALRSRYNRKYDYQRAKCEDPAVILEWFRCVRNTTAKYGIAEEDIYNFNETGFRMGVISITMVITGAKGGEKPVTIQPGHPEWVTVIDCISSRGWSLPPVIIFQPGRSCAWPWDWIIGVSENGWTDDDKLGLT
jgi:hypothetical protein